LYARKDIFILDDVLSAIDAKTEAIVVERLFGKSGMLRSLGSTSVLATHAGEYLTALEALVK
jgi:ATP-binding cassette subfamily C (CFTR/MRP) protein 1